MKKKSRQTGKRRGRPYLPAHDRANRHQIRVADHLWREWQVIAKQRQVSVSAMVREAVRADIKRFRRRTAT